MSQAAIVAFPKLTAWECGCGTSFDSACEQVDLGAHHHQGADHQCMRYVLDTELDSVFAERVVCEC